MTPKHDRFVVALLLAALMPNCTGRKPAPHAAIPPTTLREADAIAIAEEFVRTNGYVARKDADPVRANRESLDPDLPIEDLLNQRAGTLISSACGVSPSTEQEGWLVAFCYDPRQFTPSSDLERFVHSVGRGVFITAGGQPPQIVHQDLLLSSSAFKPLAGMQELDHVLRQTQPARDDRQ